MTARAVPAGSALEQTYTKRGLLALSHAMERSLDVAPRGVDRRETLVIGLFQRRAYFQVEHDRYRELAESGATCIVGFDGRLDALAPGVNAVGFGSPDPLEREWLLVVLDGHLGTSLVAHDLDDLAPNADSIEASRLFRARWSFDPSIAADEAERILDIVGDQLPSDVLARARAATARAADWATSPTPNGAWRGWPRCWSEPSTRPISAPSGWSSRRAASASAPSTIR